MARASPWTRGLNFAHNSGRPHWGGFAEMTKLVPLPWLDYCEDEISEESHKMLRYS